MTPYLLAPKEAAVALGVSERHIKNLIQEATGLGKVGGGLAESLWT
jgi:plasmid maintenance system antidote protein VapI